MMNVRRLLFGSLLSLAFLGVVVLQAVHAVGHIAHEFETAHCHHHYTQGTTEVSHAHHDYEKCFQCEFAFGAYLKPIALGFTLWPDSNFPKELFSFHSISISGYSGFHPALRAPPLG